MGNAIPEIHAVPETPMQEIKSTEQELRCSGVLRSGKACDKLLSMVVFIVSIPREIRVRGSVISEVVAGIEVKIGHKIKCNRCKLINNTIDVV